MSLTRERWKDTLSEVFLMENYAPGGNRLIVFSDLDGSLLDQTTYSFESALPAIQLLEKNGIPLVFCTSKTRAEIGPLRIELNNTHPFVSENGGAIFVPKGYFSHTWDYNKEDERYLIIELGTPYVQIREILERIQAESGTQIRGFGDLNEIEVALFCDFTEEDAKLAKQREYDEPFFLEDKHLLPIIRELATRENLQITKGGRFYHLMGKHDKGKAVKRLSQLYEVENGPHTTAGIGDSFNDLPMLENVHYPVLLQKSDDGYEEGIDLPNLTRWPEVGPKGWQSSILNLLDKLGINTSPSNQA